MSLAATKCPAAWHPYNSQVRGMGPWKDMMDMGKGGDAGLAQETENETEISQNKTPKWHVFLGEWDFTESLLGAS